MNKQAIDQIIETSPLTDTAPTDFEEIFEDTKTNLLLAELIRLKRKEQNEEYETFDAGDKGGAEYYSELVEVEGDGETKVNWDFSADTVLFLFEEDISVALQEPTMPNRDIYLSERHSPASFSGTSGINARAGWVRIAETSNADSTTVQVVAIK